MEKKTTYGFATRSIHAGEEIDDRPGATGDVVIPVHLSTTYAWKDARTPMSAFEYTRSQNPTRAALETRIATLENARFGLAFSSGLAAESAILQALVKSGDHIIAFDDLYGGTRRLFDDIHEGLETTYLDLSDLEAVKHAVRPNSRLIWVESPTNPLLKICDIRALAEIARQNGLILVVDNTFLSPYFQRPLDLGADIVFHSATKYIGGHSDVLGGAVVTSNEKYHEKIYNIQNCVGAVLSPFESYLALRGLKTLSLRMEQHQRNAFAIAHYLEKHPRVEKVHYPGLETHPNHAVCKAQASGFGAVVSFEITGTLQTAVDFLSHLELFTTAESLGGVESLIEVPATMTHVSVPPEIRQQVGIVDTLIRISVGIENIEDLIADFEQAFSKL